MVSEFLFHGAENAQTSKQLSLILNIPPRHVTAAIQRERRAGQPICSATGAKDGKPGYYLAATQEELNAICESLRHRAGEIFKTRRALLQTKEKLPRKEKE